MKSATLDLPACSLRRIKSQNQKQSSYYDGNLKDALWEKCKCIDTKFIRRPIVRYNSSIQYYGQLYRR